MWAEAILDALAEFVRLGAQLLIAELLHGGLKRIDGLDLGIRRLISRSFLVPKTLATRALIKSENPSEGTSEPIVLRSLAY